MPHRDPHDPPKICFDRVVPLSLRTSSAQRALEENDLNHPRHALGESVMMGIAAYPLKMALFTGKRWQPGRRLRCAFLDGSGVQKDRVASIAQEWSRHANVTFDFGGASSAEIRISFEADSGSWSAVGTDCLETSYFKPDEPTMNYGWLRDDTDLAECRRVVLHEFGHALGCIHEHQNPRKNSLRWNKEAVYRYFMGPPNFWTKEEIDHNVFEKYSLPQLNASAFDRDSIMLYAFPSELLLGGEGTPNNDELSTMDRRFIGQWYPKTEGRPSPRPSEAASGPRLLVPAGARSAPPSPPPALAASSPVLPDITVFEDVDFGGDSWRTSFAYSYVGDDWNDRISSFIIHAGSFQFFEHRDFGASTWSPVTLGPGYYRWVGDVGIPNDSVSSWHAFYG